MFKKILKLMLVISFLHFLLMSSSLSAATTNDSEQKSNTAFAKTVTVLIDDKTVATPVNKSHVAFWGLGAALIGFIAMSRRRGI